MSLGTRYPSRNAEALENKTDLFRRHPLLQPDPRVRPGDPDLQINAHGLFVIVDFRNLQDLEPNIDESDVSSFRVLDFGSDVHLVLVRAEEDPVAVALDAPGVVEVVVRVLNVRVVQRVFELDGEAKIHGQKQNERCARLCYATPLCYGLPQIVIKNMGFEDMTKENKT